MGAGDHKAKEACMIRSRQGFSFAKRGAAVMLAATLTAAWCRRWRSQVDGGGRWRRWPQQYGRRVLFGRGQAYTVPVSWLKTTGGTSMMAQYFVVITVDVRQRSVRRRGFNGAAAPGSGRYRMQRRDGHGGVDDGDVKTAASRCHRLRT